MADDNLEKWPYQIRTDGDIVVGAATTNTDRPTPNPTRSSRMIFSALVIFLSFSTT